jgi:hypothetical protein
LAFSYWFDKPWFLTEEKLLLCSSYLPLGVSNWSVIYISTGAITFLLWGAIVALKILPSSMSPSGLDAQGIAVGWPAMRGSVWWLAWQRRC